MMWLKLEAPNQAVRADTFNLAKFGDQGSVWCKLHNKDEDHRTIECGSSIVSISENQSEPPRVSSLEIDVPSKITEVGGWFHLSFASSLSKGKSYLQLTMDEESAHVKFEDKNFGFGLSSSMIKSSACLGYC
mmetsp:Transcript_30092/g.45976  ORF Transcript_30092/g.45976 Transcript_30092/m.45976 type:complete len:132 (+) Transcript_30092:199-594(+)